MFTLGNKKLNQDQLNTFHKYSSMLALGLIAALFTYLFWRLMMPRMDFYNELWGPAYLLAQGESPYDTASLNPVLPAVWFPMAIGFFFPLGWLSEKNALQAWYVFNIIEICVIVYLAQGNKRSLYSTVILALLCFFFPFTLNHFNLGQFSITVILCLMFSAYFAEKRQDWLAAFFLALALSKPQLGIIAVFGLSVFYFQRNGFRGVFRFGLQTFLMALLMSLPLFVSHPVWIPDWFKSMQSNYTWLHPSLFSYSGNPWAFGEPYLVGNDDVCAGYFLSPVDEISSSGCHAVEFGNYNNCHALCLELGLCPALAYLDVYICACGLEAKNSTPDLLCRCMVRDGACAGAGGQSKSIFLVGALMVHGYAGACDELGNG